MKTYTLFQKYFLLTVVVLSFPGVANAMFPTFDASNTKSSIETNVNVVKQTKEIQNVKEMSGKINSSIGSVTSSISKFKSESLDKIQEKAEKIKKEKERIEKKKAEIEKIKKEVDDYKKQVKEIKEITEDYRKQATDLKNTATSTIKDASSMTKDVSSLAKTGLSAATSAAGSTLGVSDELSAVQSKISTGGSSPSSSSSFDASDYINSGDKDYSDSSENYTEEQGNPEEQVSEEETSEEQVQEPVSVPTRASFGNAAKLATRPVAKQQVQGVAARRIDSAGTATQEVSASASSAQSPAQSPAQSIASPVSAVKAQPQMSIQNSVQKAVVSQGTTSSQKASVSPVLISSDESENISAGESSSKIGAGESVAKGSVGKAGVSSTNRATTKPRVTHKAFYDDVNMVSKRKSVMEPQLKPLNSRITTIRSTQGKNRAPDQDAPSVIVAAERANQDGAQETSGEGSASTNTSEGNSSGAFFSEESEESARQIDENGEVVEENTDAKVSAEGTTQKFIPVQKPETKPLTKGRRVPFGAKVSPAELEKELKALEAEEALEKKNDKIKTEKQTFKFSEKMVFAQLGLAKGGPTVYDNYIQGRFVLSSKFVNRCKKNAVELKDVEVLKVCVAEFVTCMNDSNTDTANACRDELNEILGDQALNTLAIALDKKNVTVNFEEKVVEKNAKDAAAAKDERSDFTVNATINEEVMKAINESTDMMAMEVILKSMTGIKDIKPDDIDVAIEKDTSENGG